MYSGKTALRGKFLVFQGQITPQHPGTAPGEGPAAVALPECAVGKPLQVGQREGGQVGQLLGLPGQLRQGSAEGGPVVGAGQLAAVTAPDQGMGLEQRLFLPAEGALPLGQGGQTAVRVKAVPSQGTGGTRPRIQAPQSAQFGAGAGAEGSARSVRMVPRKTQLP